jgi:hypothetical protein
MRRVSVVWLCVFGVLASACQVPTDPDDVDDIEIELTASPTEATASPSTGVTYLKEKGTDSKPDVYDVYDWVTSFSVNIVNQESLGATITAVNVTARQASGGIIVPPSGGDVEFSRFSVQASGNRVEANGGTSSVGVKVWYDLPLGLPEALITVAVSFKDDDDVTFTKTIDVRVRG